MQWDFTPANVPWQNGPSEALVKSITKVITVAIGESIMTFSELQTVCYETANLVNERPIGRHPTSPEDGAYLCPNDLLLGRSTPRVPGGPFREMTNPPKMVRIRPVHCGRLLKEVEQRFLAKFNGPSKMAYHAW